MSHLSKSFYVKYQDGRFSDFTAQDWISYFLYQAMQHKIDYRITNKHVDSAIMNAVKKNYTPMEIKLMIDFIFECNHGFSNIGIYLLSSRFINKIFNDAKSWKDGTYQSKSINSRNREFIDSNNNDGQTIII